LGHWLPWTEAVVRLPAAVGVQLGVIALWWIVRRLWGSRTAWTTAVVAELSPFLAYYAAEARCYGLWFFVIGLTVIAWLRWYEELTTDGSAASVWTWALGWGVAGAGGLWLHLFHVFLLAGQAAVVFVLLGADRRLAVRRSLVLGTATVAGAVA